MFLGFHLCEVSCLLQEKRTELFSLPNCLSYVRILLLPLFVWFYAFQHWYGWAFAVILISAATDVADGWIARRFHLTTELGKIVDPVADKLTQAVVSGCLILRYPHMLYLFLLILLKEGFQGIGGLLFYRRVRSMRSSEWFGKLSTAVFYGVVAYFVLFAPDPSWKTDLCLLISGGFMALAWGMYAFRFFRILSALKEPSLPQEQSGVQTEGS